MSAITKALDKLSKNLPKKLLGLGNMNAILHNRTFLYIVFAFSLLNLYVFTVNREFIFITFFILFGFLTSFFSKNMVAAGNVSDESELEQIASLASILVNHYTECVGETNNTVENTAEQQNYYAQNQKQNPHTPKVMVSLGLSEDDVRHFIQECLFPEIS